VPLVDLGLPELADEQIGEVSEAAEDAARKFVFSQVKQKEVASLDIAVEAEGTKPVTFAVEVNVKLQPDAKAIPERELANGAVKAAFTAIETYLRKLT
jgi:hypothetical protein